MPTVAEMLRGRSHLSLKQFKKRGYVSLYTLVLGLADVLRPVLFDSGKTACQCLTLSGCSQREFTQTDSGTIS